MEDVKKVTSTYTGPLEVQKNIHYTYSDSARITTVLKAPEAHSYSQLEEPYLEFIKGINVEFFDDSGQSESRITANYAIRYTEKKQWNARDSVVFVNQKGEKLNTDFLVWDEESGKIHSDDHVKITTPSQIIMGKGFESDQTFSYYKIYKVTGEIWLDDEDEPQAPSEEQTKKEKPKS